MTRKQCMKLKEWGLPQLGKGHQIFIDDTGKVHKKPISYCPTLEDLMDFVFEVARQRVTDPDWYLVLFRAGTYHDYGCGIEDNCGDMIDDLREEADSYADAVYRLIEKMMEKKEE